MTNTVASDMYYEYGEDGFYYDDSYEEPMEYIIADKLSLYVSPVLLFVAIIGNSVCVIVMSHFGFSTLSPCLYLAILAFVDLLLLLSRVGNVWAKSIWNQDLTEIILIQSNVSCQVYSFLSNLLMHLCSWFLALLVLEVTLVLSFPRKAHVICVKERVKNLSLLVVLLLICVNAHFFWTYGLVRLYPTAEKQYCIFTEYGGFYSKYFRGLVWPIMDTLFAAMLPNTIIVACLVYIALRGCLKDEKLRALMENHFVIDAASLRSFIRLTILLGALSVVMTLPETAYNIFEFAMERLQLEHLGTRESYFAQRALAQLLCYIIRDFFLAFKIFLYLVVWGSFRDKAIGVITLRKYRTYCQKRQTVRDAYVKAESERRWKLRETNLTHMNVDALPQVIEEDQPRQSTSRDSGAAQHALLGASSVV